MNSIVSIILYILNIVHLIALIITIRFLGSNIYFFFKRKWLRLWNNSYHYNFYCWINIILYFWRKFNPAVTVFEDSIWFSLVSITTTGYGDIVPITLPEKIVSGGLMISGVSFATFATASLAGSIFTSLREEKRSREKSMKDSNKKLLEKLENNQKELNEIKEMVKNLEK